MGTTIDEIILTEKEIAEEFQRVADTHLVREDMSLEELYCDDTEIIQEELKRYQGLADFHNQIVDTMSKYQQIEQIIDNYDLEAWEVLEKIKEVMKNE